MTDGMLLLLLLLMRQSSSFSTRCRMIVASHSRTRMAENSQLRSNSRRGEAEHSVYIHEAASGCSAAALIVVSLSSLLSTQQGTPHFFRDGIHGTTSYSTVLYHEYHRNPAIATLSYFIPLYSHLTKLALSLPTLTATTHCYHQHGRGDHHSFTAIHLYQQYTAMPAGGDFFPGCGYDCTTDTFHLWNRSSHALPLQLPLIHRHRVLCKSRPRDGWWLAPRISKERVSKGNIISLL